MKFSDLGLGPEILQSIQALGFESPTAIQREAIPVLVAGRRDFVGLAQTGTGKTAAFGLPLIERIDPSSRQTQGVVLCPTRELCLQIAGDLKRFAAHAPGINVTAVYGGASITDQIQQLKKGAQIVVATPGRLLDLIERKAARLQQVRVVVLDEADEMLNMGFKEELDGILSRMPTERVTWLFSATMAKGVKAIARDYQNDPVEVSVAGRNESAANIQHICFMVHERDRYQALKRTLDFFPDVYGLVFCRTRAETQAVADRLMQDGYRAEAIHGDLSQGQRDAVMKKFRQRSIRVLVATDVAARGIDVDDISHVIHYRLSDEAATYTHRSGRTARAGKSGMSIALINMVERRRIAELERRNNIRIEMMQIPDGRAICENQMQALIDRVVSSEVDEKEIKDYLPPAYQALCALDKKEIIKRFISVEFNHFLDYYRHAGDINVPDRPGPKRERRGTRDDDQRRRQRPRDPSMRRFSINVGRSNKINAGAIVRLICDNTGIRSKQIGAIDLGRDISYFEVAKDAVSAMRSKTTGLKLDGRKISIRGADGSEGRGGERGERGSRRERN